LDRYPLFSQICNGPIISTASLKEKIYLSVHTMYIHMSSNSKNRSKRVNFRLPQELIDMADVTAKVEHKNRTEIVKEALDEHLHEITDEEFKQKVIELYLDSEIEYEMLKKFLGREDAEAVKASKDILERGDELAEELSEL